MYPPSPTPSSHLGNAALVILKLVAIFLALAAVGLTISSFMLFVPQPPQVDMSTSQFGFRYDPNTLGAFFEGNLSLTVHGLYRVEDIYLTIRAHNATGFSLADAAQGPFTLVPEVPHREHVVLAVTLGTWLRTIWPLTHDDTFTVTMGLQGKYTAGFIRAAFTLTSVVPWRAPLQNYHFDFRNSTFTPSGSTSTWSLPYYLNTSAYLAGPATIVVTVANETSTITSNTTALTLGGSVAGRMNFTLTQAQALDLATTNHTLRITMRVTLANGLSVTVVQTVAWTRRT